jgi:hypothetical protein
VQLLGDCHQIVTKNVESIDRGSLAVEIRVRVAHRDANAGVSQQLFHRHDVDATVHEARSECVPQRVQRHTEDLRLLAPNLPRVRESNVKAKGKDQ